MDVNLKQNKKEYHGDTENTELNQYLNLSSLCLCGENIQQVKISILICSIVYKPLENT